MWEGRWTTENDKWADWLLIQYAGMLYRCYHSTVWLFACAHVYPFFFFHFAVAVCWHFDLYNVQVLKCEFKIPIPVIFSQSAFLFLAQSASESVGSQWMFLHLPTEQWNCKSTLVTPDKDCLYTYMNLKSGWNRFKDIWVGSLQNG